MIPQYYLCLTTVILLKVLEINAHGRLLVPPARSSAWRENPTRFPPNYEDNQMFCGGFDHQWNKNGGKCGICGEGYSLPKRYEYGGDLYRGHIVRNYSLNSVIKVDVEITANHKGWFEFRLCNIDNMNEATQDCLDKTLLKDSTGVSRFDWPNKALVGHFTQDLIIPNNFQCNRCVFQWKYNSGNSWGTDFDTGVGCMGCGPQEQFYGCADISISNGGVPPQTTAAPTTNQKSDTTTKQTIVTTTSKGETTFTCVKDGLFAFNGCTQYYQCIFTNTANAMKVLKSCPSGLLFDQNMQVCNWATQVICGNNVLTTSFPTKITTGFPQTTSTKQTTGKSTSLGPNTLVSGFYWWSWSQNIIPPSGINMGVCFSGYVTVSDALRDCATIFPKLPGDKYLSLGGGNAAGHFTKTALSNIDAAISSNALQGWQGVVYDIEEGDSDLAAAFKSSFANSKAKGLKVLVTTSHSRPYGISDGSQLMTSFFADSNIDYISPQLYTSGMESANDFTAVGTMWSEYATSKAKIVPSVVIGSRDYPTAQAYFANVGVTLAGYVHWAQTR